MTLDELFHNNAFLQACDLMPEFIENISQYTYFDNQILGLTHRRLTCLVHYQSKRANYIVDYTHLTQEEINTLISAKIKYDIAHENNIIDDTFGETYRKIISVDNKNIKLISLSRLTSKQVTNLIHKNEVFIANLNSLYASNKILAELDAL